MLVVALQWLGTIVSDSTINLSGIRVEIGVWLHICT